MKALSIVGYIVMIGWFFWLLATRNLLSSSPLIISLQAVALLLFFWARVTLRRRSYHVAANPTEGGLVTTGPYRHLRHPIYAAFCLFTLAGVGAHFSWRTGVCGALILGSAVARLLCEEILVAARYPEYRQYAATTFRMIPYLF